MRLIAPKSPPSARARAARRRRIAALGALALVALVLGMVVGARHTSSSQRLAARFTAAWERGDYQAMYAMLTPESRRRVRLGRFVSDYTRARDTATAVRITAGKPRDLGSGLASVPMAVTTRIFGTVRADLRLRTKSGHVGWAPNLVFPGLARGITLRRVTSAPKRAPILARNGQTIVEGPGDARSSPMGSVGESIAGSVGQALSAGDQESLFARGFPDATPVGLSGLERVFENRLAGDPGGQLFAGDQLLASSEPRPAPPVHTTIDPALQAAAVQALAGRFGGIAALDARSGEVRALAGIAFSAPQPPGSTFKIITATSVLEARVAKTSDEFPIASKATIDGVDLQNADGEYCGGTLVQSFARSCNSVFAPLGVKVGAKRLVATAERYGFNEQPSIPGALPSTIPAASEIGSDLALGSTAIGQGRVLATPLELASVAQTIASHGLRRRPTLAPGDPSAPAVRATSRRIANALERLMVAVVQYGTGVKAALPGVTVAGKTGTAELESTVPPKGTTGPQPPPSETNEPPGSKTDAWFTGFAPVHHPRIAVCVLLVRAGAGGDTAAPAARMVLAAGLR
jgi:peptidoglycan glycosyltransferase